MKFPYIATLLVALGLWACRKPPARISWGPEGGSESGNVDPKNHVVPEKGWEDTEVEGPTALAFSTAFARLTRLQWENSVRDVLLLAEQPNLSSLFPSDPQNTFFANDGNSLVVSAPLWKSYISAAEDIANRLAADQKLVNKLIPESSKALNGDAKILDILKPLTLRAFRKPATTEQLNRLVALYKNGKALTGKADETVAGIQVVVHMLLQSPLFLYRLELGSKADSLTELTAYEVASRLSYSAWNTIPDAELFKAAQNGDLLTDEGREKQAKRVMASPKADAVLVDFYKTVLQTTTFSDTLKKDSSIVKAWPQTMGKTLVTEAELFINEVVVKEKGGINQLLTAPYAFVNADTAPIYKVAAPSGGEFVKTVLNAKERMGFFTQIGFLARRAGEKESNAIRRGSLISDKLLCADVVSNVPPQLPKLEEPTGKKTARDIVNETSGPGTCGGACHTEYINPSGYAFENFDAAGNWRTTDNDQPVDASSKLRLSTGLVPYNGPQDFVKKITASRDLHECLIQKAVGMLLARKTEAGDETLVKNVAYRSGQGVSTRDLFTEILKDSRIKLRGNGKTGE